MFSYLLTVTFLVVSVNASQSYLAAQALADILDRGAPILGKLSILLLKRRLQLCQASTRDAPSPIQPVIGWLSIPIAPNLSI